MCGIVGVPARGAGIEWVAAGMATQLPTAALTVKASTDPPVGLANRRLAIIDPHPEGDQPLTDPSGDLVITYNGEVYNFRELRPSSSAAATVPHRAPTPRSCSTPTPSGARSRSSASTACSRSRSGIADARAVPRPRPLRRQAALLLDLRAASSCSAPRSRRCSSTRPLGRGVSLPHLLEYFTFQNIFTDGTLFAGRQDAPPRPSPDHRGAAAPRGRSATGTSTSPRRTAASDEEYARSSTGSCSRRSSASSSRRARRRYLSGGMDSGSITASRRAPA